MTTGTRRIVEHYVEHGGPLMDEERYQLYRITLLTRWLSRYSVRCCDSHPEQWWCEVCDAVVAEGVDMAVTHMRLHLPRAFVLDEEG